MIGGIPAHLTVDQLLRAAEAFASDRTGHLRHPLDCTACRRPLRRILAELAPAAPPPPPPPAPHAGESVFGRLDSPYLTAFAEGARQAPARAAEIVDRPWKEARAAFAALAPAAAVAVILEILDRAHEATDVSPRAGLKLAALARKLCHALDDGAVPHEARGELAARAWLVTGYARALAGKVGLSFNPGFKLAEDRITDLDGVEAAVLSRLAGSAHARRRRPVQALAFLERAERLARDTGEVLEEARAVSEQAVVYVQAGQMARGLALLGRAVALEAPWMSLEDAPRARLLLAVLHATAGHPRVAGELLAAAEREARALGLELPALFALARARLAAERRDRGATERQLAAALASALSTGAHGEGAAAAFHLAALHADSGRGEVLSALAKDVVRLAVPGPLPGELRALLRRLAALLRSSGATRERVLALQRRFKNRLPPAPWPLQGLAVLFDEELTESLTGQRTRLPQSTGRRAGGRSQTKESRA